MNLQADPTLESRIWTKVNKRGPKQPHMKTRCWVWTGATTDGGYARIYTSAGARLVHRIVWTLFVGAIPTNKFVLHRCDNPPCVRLSHLFVGTKKDNAQDRDAKGRRAPPRGALNGRAKLSAEDVALIRKLHASEKIDQKQLAINFGVTTSQISAIITRRCW